MSKKILVAEDDEDIRTAIRILLESAGYDVHLARDGIEALERGRLIKPDLVILDVMMPGMVGYQVCEALKNEPDTSGVYVLFVTARGVSQAAGAVKQCGGDDVIGKPFDIDELKRKVRKGLGEV